MDCKTTNIKRFSAAITLVETMIAIGVGSLVLLVLGSFLVYSTRSFSAMASYSAINQGNRGALDEMSRQIRQSRGLVSFTATNLVFKDADGNESLVFTYDKVNKTFSLIEMGVPTVLLSDCIEMNWQIFTRVPNSSTFTLNPTSDPAKCKLIQFDWVSARDQGMFTNTDTVQSMKIVMRKKG